MLCLVIEHGITSIELSNCHTEEQSEAEFFCAGQKRNGIIPCSIKPGFHIKSSCCESVEDLL